MTNTNPRVILYSLVARCQELRSPCGDGDLVWREWGAANTERPPLVLLHGGFGSWNHWVRTIPALETQYRVIAVDLPGCGDSADPPKPYDAASLVEILSGGLDRILPDDTPFDLISFSFGGVLSGLLAHAQSRRIHSLTLIGSPVLGLTGTGPANELVEVPRDLPAAEAAPLYRHNLQKLMVHDPAAADDLALTIQTDNMAKARLRSRGIARTSVLSDSLRDLPCRLNGIFGDKDTTLYPDLSGIRDYVEEIHPGAPIHVIPNAGHWVQFEAWETVNKLLPDVLN
ncbi:MAG: alpha/beta fold hydrolase [Alphaproteobacteria bacterium]|nr:alpha/beta fold hydrolase [Alphaproteobacteria bacterium]